MTASTRRTIVRAATIIMVGNIASRLLGLVREQVIAALFGASGVTDAFVAASTVPTTIYDFLIGGAISAALVPVFSDYADDPAHEGDLSRMVSTLLTLAAIVLSVIVVVLIAFAPQVIDVLGVGFAPAVRAEAINMVRWLLPATFFMAMSGILTALLYARQQFVMPAFVTATYNVSIIVVALLLAGTLGVQSLVAGVLIGALMQVVLQARAVRGLRVRPSLDLSHPGLRRALKLYLPVALGFIVTIAGIFLDRNLASRTGEGNMAAMRFATTLIQFPLGLVSVALSAAILPTLSRQAGAQGSTPGDAYRHTLALGIKLAMIAMIPAMVGLIILREPLVRLLFERGRFDAADTGRTALAFLAYAPQLPFVALDQLLIAAFYARKNTVTPVIIGVVCVGLYLVTALGLLDAWGMPALAFANAVQNSAHAIILLVLIWPAVGGLAGLGIGQTTGKVLLASVAMGAAAWFISERMGGSLVSIGVAGAAGVAVYAAGVWLLRVEEARLLVDVVVARFRRAA
ncbi:MAG: murein biosynthesis integral membrane protein MurJ [Chloroflexi bacterium]|nr:murein biosynthesis integral membrane protein MurJ [Chloroflexota bacterium]